MTLDLDAIEARAHAADDADSLASARADVLALVAAVRACHEALERAQTDLLETERDARAAWREATEEVRSLRAELAEARGG